MPLPPKFNQENRLSNRWELGVRWKDRFITVSALSELPRQNPPPTPPTEGVKVISIQLELWDGLRRQRHSLAGRFDLVLRF